MRIAVVAESFLNVRAEMGGVYRVKRILAEYAADLLQPDALDVPQSTGAQGTGEN